MFSEERLASEIADRKSKSLYRSLKKIPSDFIDFSSNDYLGFSRMGLLRKKILQLKTELLHEDYGSGGSRLLAGNNELFEMTEDYLRNFYHAGACLIFNSGYDANLGFYSTVPKRGDFIFYDELVHASIHDGIRLSFAQSFRFAHNDLNDLKEKISRQDTEGKSVFIAVESVYSMDGDMAPLVELAAFCKEKGFALIVDEAHATGIYGENGSGLCNELQIEKDVYARVFTFGKALGTHGAAVAGSALLKEYLINFCRPFIFSTSFPSDSVLSIYAAHQLSSETSERQKLKDIIDHFRIKAGKMDCFLNSFSAIQACVIPGNENVQRIAEALQQKKMDVRAVKSPTVAQDRERLRISLHSFNTINDINRLFEELSIFLPFKG